MASGWIQGDGPKVQRPRAGCLPSTFCASHGRHIQKSRKVLSSLTSQANEGGKCLNMGSTKGEGNKTK